MPSLGHKQLTIVYYKLRDIYDLHNFYANDN